MARMPPPVAIHCRDRAPAARHINAPAGNKPLAYATCRLHICRMSLDAVFRALADPVRRDLLDRLFARNGQTLSELCEGHDMTRQAVTKHLAVLEEANLVATLKRGREKLHYLNPVPIHEIAERWIGKYERTRLDALGALKKTLEGED
jgi:DNA-binding transcriptional ArsR family regulator